MSEIREYTKNDVMIASITKTDESQKVGVKLVERGKEGKIYVRDVEKDGIFGQFTGIEKGMRVLKFQNKPVEEYAQGVKQIQHLLDNTDVGTLELEVATVRSVDELFKLELEKVKVDTRKEFRNSTHENYPKGNDDYGEYE